LSTLTLLREQITANRRAYQVTVAIVVAALALFGLLVTLALGWGSGPPCATPAPRSPTRPAGPATPTWSRA
jgi:hypothetical protein